MDRIPATKNELRTLVASLVGERPEDLHEHDNLAEYGIDSLSLMSIVSSWSRQGLEIKYCDLSERPTIADWWSLVGADGRPPGGVGRHVYLEIDGFGVDADRLRRAVLAVADRHPMLRARLFDDGATQILPKPAWPGLTRYDLSDLDTAELDRELDQIRSLLSHRRLAVELGEVFDVRLSLLPGGRTRLHIELDLRAADVVSLGIVLDELAACYADGPGALQPLAYTFPEYRADLAGHRDSARAGDREYWASRRAELPPAPRLPLEVDPATIERPTFRRLAYWLEPERYQRLTRICQRNRVDPAMALVTAFAEILGLWSGQSRLLLTLPVSDRHGLHEDVPGIVGDFTELSLLDVDLTGESFVDNVGAVQRRFEEDGSHSHPDAKAFMAPVMFSGGTGGRGLPSRRFRNSFGEAGYMISQTSQVWLDHQFVEMDNGLYLSWDFVDALFPSSVVEAMFGAYREVLDWLLADEWTAQAPVGLPEGQRLVRDVVSETEEIESGRLLHERFFEWAEAEPDRVALLWGARARLSYGELGQWALRVAGELAGCGVRPGDVVAVMTPSGPERIAATLGILAAGCTYMPIGCDQPIRHRELMMEAVGVHAAVANSRTWPVTLPGVSTERFEHPPLLRPIAVRPSDSAYVIPAAGGNGRPRCVEVSHRSVVNTVEDINDRFGVGADDRVLAVSEADSDLSVYDLFGLLSAGGAVVLPDRSEQRDARRWAELCGRYAVTVWNSAPESLDRYLSASAEYDAVDRLRLALVSGYGVGLDLPIRFRERRPHGQFIALGGAPEAAIWSNSFEVGRVSPDWPSIPCGFALRNQRYRVVDAEGRDCPDWVPGELWIGGVGVAEGYRGDPVRSKEKFVRWASRRWYRTGELGRFRHDGTLEHLGRRPIGRTV